MNLENRKLLWVFFLIGAIAAIGCGDGALKELEVMIKKALKDNKGIDQAEYTQMKALIDENPTLKEEVPTEADLTDLIDRVAQRMHKAGRPPIDYPVAIFSDKDTASRKTTFQVFYENSGSMDGYLNGRTEFLNALPDILTKIKLREDSIELFYVNSEAYPFNEVISDYMDFLKPENFKKFGNRGNSEINNILRLVADSTCAASHRMSILVSDYIYSIKNKNIGNELDIMKHITTLHLKGLAKKNNALLMIRINSMFKGKYYPMNNTKAIDIQEYRPVYIWVFGPEKTVIDFPETFRIREIRGYDKHLILLNEKTGELPYHTILNKTNKEGSFQKADRSSGDMLTSIENAAPNRNGEFQFALAADLSAYPVQADYITDIKNYSVQSDQGDSFQVVRVDPIEKIEPNDKSKKGSANYIITIQHSSGKLTKGEQTLTILLKKGIPQWVDEVSTDSDLTAEDRKDKTFGFKYLVGGAAQAFGYTTESSYVKFPLKIKN